MKDEEAGPAGQLMMGLATTIIQITQNPMTPLPPEAVAGQSVPGIVQEPGAGKAGLVSPRSESRCNYAGLYCRKPYDCECN